MIGTQPRRVGVEEEFLLVDPDARPRAVANTVLSLSDSEREDDLTGELQREQVETGTRPCRQLADLAAELVRTRREAADAAARAHVTALPIGLSPLAADPTPTAEPRYTTMIEVFGPIAREQLTCGCHVHVEVADREEAVAVLDRIRPWLAPLLAITANSPFWNGEDTDHASFRSQVWGRWPSAGVYEKFGSAAGYEAVTRAMLDTGTVLDSGMLYFDARPSEVHPTVEIRVADVCRTPEAAVLLAGLTRALVSTAARDWRAGRGPDPVRSEVLRLAAWRAARFGPSGELVDPLTWKPAPAEVVFGRLVEHCRAALDETGDVALVERSLQRLVATGGGAAEQRAVYEATGDLAAVVRDAAAHLLG